MTEVGPVESGVPIPPKKSLLKPEDKLRLSQMKVGDSRLIKGLTQQSVASRASRAWRNHGMRFTTRAVEGGVRVWRIE
jgi:hypothetical protein